MARARTSVRSGSSRNPTVSVDGRSTEKHRAILAAAADLFLSAGYSRTTMDAVAESAGVSKATVYSHFSNKSELFQAIVIARCELLFSPFRDPSTDLNDIRAALTALGRQYLTMLLDPMSLALYRSLIGEVERDPGLGRKVYAVGGAVVVAQLARHFERWMEDGSMLRADATMAAEQFYGMLTGHLQLRALLGVGEPHGRGDLDSLTEKCVAVFLRGYGADLRATPGA